MSELLRCHGISVAVKCASVSRWGFYLYIYVLRQLKTPFGHPSNEFLAIDTAIAVGIQCLHCLVRVLEVVWVNAHFFK